MENQYERGENRSVRETFLRKWENNRERGSKERSSERSIGEAKKKGFWRMSPPTLEQTLKGLFS